MEATALDVTLAGSQPLDFGRAIRLELTPAYPLAGYILGDAAEAEDAVQEAMVLAWRKWDQLREPERLRAWFTRILVNVCRERLRSRRRKPVAWLDPERLGSADDPFREALTRDAMGRAMVCLSLDQRMVVALRYWADLSLSEIAERLDVPLGTVKSRHHYALLALRAQLRKDSGEGKR